MQGFSIIFFAVQSMLRDPGATLRLAVLPWLVALSVILCTFQILGGIDPASLAASNFLNVVANPGYIYAFTISLFVFCVVGAWVGLSWHRYVLLREGAGAVLPHRNPQAFEYHFDAAMKFALLAFAVYMMIRFLLVPLVPVLGFAGPGAKIISLAINALVVSILLRYGLVMPAAALERPISMGDSWEATEGYSGPLFAIGLVIVLLVELAGLVPGSSLASSALQLCAAWAGFLIAIAAITVLYGVRVQGRRLIV